MFLNYCMWVGVLETVTDYTIAYDKSHLVVMLFNGSKSVVV